MKAKINYPILPGISKKGVTRISIIQIGDQVAILNAIFLEQFLDYEV